MKSFIHNQNSILIESTCHRHNIELLILFGSAASETTHAGSDLDLAVKPAIGKQISKLHLIRDLESTLKEQQIDLSIITPNTDPLLLFEIFSNGKPLYEAVPGIFEKTKLKAWHLYLDSLPIRQFEKSYNQKRLRELSDVT